MWRGKLGIQRFVGPVDELPVAEPLVEVLAEALRGVGVNQLAAAPLVDQAGDAAPLGVEGCLEERALDGRRLLVRGQFHRRRLLLRDHVGAVAQRRNVLGHETDDAIGSFDARALGRNGDQWAALGGPQRNALRQIEDVQRYLAVASPGQGVIDHDAAALQVDVVGQR